MTQSNSQEDDENSLRLVPLDSSHIVRKLFNTTSSKAAKSLGHKWLECDPVPFPAHAVRKERMPALDRRVQGDVLGPHSGFGRIHWVKAVRVERTKFAVETRQRQSYLDQAVSEITSLKSQATQSGMRLCVRMNGTSDIDFEFESLSLFGRSADGKDDP